MKKPIRINANRWFQKTYGNTYFSCYVVFNDGSTETITKFQYGYGDYYLQYAVEWLIQNEYITEPEDMRKTANWQLLQSIGCSYCVADVQRKKDL